MLQLAFRNLKSLPKTIRLIRGLMAKFQKTNDQPPFTKVAKVDGRYFWGLSLNGFPSPATDLMFENEMTRVVPFKKHPGLRTLLISVTKKCPMNCEHCFEWYNLNQKESLSVADLQEIVRRYQELGTPQIFFGGGEPMVRIKDLYKVLDSAKTGTDFWIYTSGFGFSPEHAHKLRAAGLTGLLISIDHHEPEEHNRFRGYPGAFEAAANACRWAQEAGLVVALSLCVRPDYASREDLSAYMDLSRKLGASFVRFLEARSTGRYQDQTVALSPDQLQQIKTLYHDYNTAPEYWDYPLIDLPDNQRRNIGCVAGGHRFFYIDTDGDAHACPFCSRKVCNVLEHEAPEVIRQLKQGSCHIFEFTKV
jgi:MoaA/NifB/PqqE/SkfB family radical SAM enzyme